MSFEVPENRRYLETHEWVHIEDGRARVGITDFDQDELTSSSSSSPRPGNTWIGRRRSA